MSRKLLPYTLDNCFYLSIAITFSFIYSYSSIALNSTCSRMRMRIFNRVMNSMTITKKRVKSKEKNHLNEK